MSHVVTIGGAAASLDAGDRKEWRAARLVPPTHRGGRWPNAQHLDGWGSFAKSEIGKHAEPFRLCSAARVSTLPRPDKAGITVGGPLPGLSSQGVCGMHDFSPASLVAAFGAMLRLDRLSDVTVLLLGILVGLIAKNLYSMAMRSFGFVGGFASRLLVGWWEEFRRETPNVVDFAMAIVSPFDGRDVLLMDPLI
eukprot:gene31908-36619_t